MASLAIAMPVFNEADGIVLTLEALDHALAIAGEETVIFIQDDLSTDETCELIKNCSKSLKAQIQIQSNPRNKGHGPTVITAYRRAIESDADLVLQLDSDGQFDPNDLAKLIMAARTRVDIAVGIRHSRKDPWYRKLLTIGLKTLLFLRYRKFFKDPNSPIRVFKKQVLKDLLNYLPPNALIPNIYLLIIANLHQRSIENLSVTHRSRSGNTKTGSTWTSKSKLRSIFRLIRFALRALKEFLRFQPKKFKN